MTGVGTQIYSKNIFRYPTGNSIVSFLSSETNRLKQEYLFLSPFCE